MKLAVVILNWNGEALLKSYLPKVVQYTPDTSIYVIDNASNDGSVAMLKDAFPNVTIIENSENLGFAGGYNRGLEFVDEEVYCLLNSDVEVTPNWTEPILELFKDKREVGIAQPKILDLKNKGHFEYAGAGGGFLDKFGYPFCRGRIFQALEKDEGQYDDITEVFWATGACMFIRKGLFKELNGFDERYFAHQEEIDLCWRAKNRGNRVYYVGLSHVYHLGGFTLKNSNPNKTFLNFRNSLFSIVKNLPIQHSLPLIFMRLVLDGIAAFRFLTQLKPMHSLAILRAHISFYRYFGEMYRKREKAKIPLKYHMVTSIVWSHFVHGITDFNILVKD